MTRAEKRILWNQRISDYHASGLNVVQWCSLQDISLASMRYWLSRQKQQQTSEVHEMQEVQWLLVENENSMSSAKEQTDINIQFGRASLTVGRNFSEETLARVLKILTAYA